MAEEEGHSGEEDGALNRSLDHYCRMCGMPHHGEVIGIYEEIGNFLQLADKINHYLPITVSAEDELPLGLCGSCVDKLDIIHEVIVSCLDANEKFFEALQSDTDEKEAVEQNGSLLNGISENEACQDITKSCMSEQTDDEQGCEETDDIKVEIESINSDPDESLVKTEERPKVKKVVVLKLVHANSQNLSPSIRIAKALEYLQSKKKKNINTDNLIIKDLSSDPAHVRDGNTLYAKNVNGSSGVINTINYESENNNPSKECLQNVNMEVARIAEFCVVTAKEGERKTDSPVLESQISKVLDTVDHGTKLRIVEAVQNIVANSRAEYVRHENSSLVTCSLCETILPHTMIDNHVCGKALKLKQPDITCKLCNKKFRDRLKYKIHRQTHINIKSLSYVCSQCDKQFSRKDSLHIHMMTHSGIKPHECKHCGRRFLHRNSLEVHQACAHSDERPWLCDTCGQRFAHRNNLRVHARNHLDDSFKKRFTCEVCNKAFRNRFLVREHMKSHTGERPFFCTHCKKSFSTRDRLKQHEAIHLGIQPFQCSICSVSFVRKGNLTKHYKTHATDKVVMCRICKATFPSVAGLLNHRKSHSPDEWEQNKSQPSGGTVKVVPQPETFQCSVCNKYLSSKLSLNLHMRVHTGEKPFSCEVCNKRFTQKPALTYHMRLHTGERPHACQFCGKGFNSKVGKESHERIHTGERPYKCGQCGVGFRCSANLRQHTWIHTDNRPFVCEVCSKLFRRREALQVHMRIHTGERPYSCPTCNRSFTQKGDMLKHSRSHNKPKEKMTGVACLYCGQVFSHKKYYKMHLDKCHMTDGNVNLIEVHEKELSQEQHILVEDQEIMVQSEDILVHGEEMLVQGEEVLVHPHHQVVFHDDNPLLQLNEAALIVKAEEKEELSTVAITSDDIITTFPEITIVSNDVQEYEIEYRS